MPNVVAFPIQPGEDIPEQLRDLAERVQSGEFGIVHSLTFVADCGSGKVEVGMLGNSPLPGPAAHLMLAMGMRKLET